MNEAENNNQEDLEEEREKLKTLGVKSTWNILTDLTKKKKEN
ncbi:MAG: hypothetical protein ACFFBH_04830 [Promethearchaeota archaeon]